MYRQDVELFYTLCKLDWLGINSHGVVEQLAWNGLFSAPANQFWIAIAQQ